MAAMLLKYLAGGDEYEEAVYHSERWRELVELGFVTMRVDGAVALLIRQRYTVKRRG